MTPTQSFLTHWYFHLPNLALAALMYTLIGRYVLDLLFSRRPDAVIIRVFASVTDPVINLVRLITPAIVPTGLVLVFAIVWLMALRLVWFITCVVLGMRPTIGG